MKSGDVKLGFYMQRYLKQNLDPIPAFLAKKWDVVGVVTGRGLVGCGKSTMASQVGLYIAWRLAGGEQNDDGTIIKYPTKPLNFTLKNFVFNPEELMEKATTLPRNSVIIYDEGLEGMDSMGIMKQVNQAMAQFYQRCRTFGHVIIVVLPNFFKLHEDYAVTRSLFLVDTYPDKDFNRGFFNYYNPLQKEKLFFFGKKRIGITAKYSAANCVFWGRFTNYFPFDRLEYDKLKQAATGKKRLSKVQARLKKHRDCGFVILKKELGWNDLKIAKTYTELSQEDLLEEAVARSCVEFNKEEKTKRLVDETNL